MLLHYLYIISLLYFVGFFFYYTDISKNILLNYSVLNPYTVIVGEAI